MSESVTHAIAMLETWRARGDDRVNRVRFAMIEAYAKRASTHVGEPRRVMDARLRELVEAYSRDVEVPRDRTEKAPETSPFAALLDELTQHADTYSAPAELADYLRAVWSKVSAEKRVRESLARVPRNAGPLNSNSLVHRSLALMQDVSPAYLQHFLSYLDALAWMEEMTHAGIEAPRAVVAKKTARGKAR